MCRSVPTLSAAHAAPHARVHHAWAARPYSTYNSKPCVAAEDANRAALPGVRRRSLRLYSRLGHAVVGVAVCSNAASSTACADCLASVRPCQRHWPIDPPWGVHALVVGVGVVRTVMTGWRRRRWRCGGVSPCRCVSQWLERWLSALARASLRGAPHSHEGPTCPAATRITMRGTSAGRTGCGQRRGSLPPPCCATTALRR